MTTRTRSLRLSFALGAALASASTARAVEFPALLSETGLYADVASARIAPDVMGYTPQYALWTDGATKQRWIALPADVAIDASDPDHWDFPAGTRLWKEFSFERRVETRYMVLDDDGRWNFATYLWRADGSDADLVPERGIPDVAVEGGTHDVPGRWDCLACHGPGRNQVLGFGALQLSADRDPAAAHAATPRPGDVDLDALVDRGLVVGLSERARRPRIAADDPIERAALGYLHANCGHCHADAGALSARALRLDRAVGADEPGDAASWRTVALGGDVDVGDLLDRMVTLDPARRMPPLGTERVDRDALELLTAWLHGPSGNDDPASPTRRSASPNENEPEHRQEGPR